jgi:universal stress protein F
MYKKILISIDYADEESWRRALPVALEEAKYHGAELSVVTVIPEIIRLPVLPDNYGDQALEHVKGTITKIVADHGTDIAVESREGSIYREILKQAEAIGADLIVMASSKGDFPNYMMGPNVARVVRNANCSVLIVRG